MSFTMLFIAVAVLHMVAPSVEGKRILAIDRILASRRPSIASLKAKFEGAGEKSSHALSNEDAGGDQATSRVDALRAKFDKPGKPHVPVLHGKFEDSDAAGGADPAGADTKDGALSIADPCVIQDKELITKLIRELKAGNLNMGHAMHFEETTPFDEMQEVPRDDADKKVAEEFGIAQPEEWKELRCVGMKCDRGVYKVGEQVLKRVCMSIPSEADEFSREIQVMTELATCPTGFDGKCVPNTLRLLKSTWMGKCGYMLLPLVDHPDLLDYVKAALYLGWDEDYLWNTFGHKAATMVSQAVMQLHWVGVGHGDLKLDNILVTEISEAGFVPEKSPITKTKENSWLFDQAEGKRAKPGLLKAIDDLKNGRVPLQVTLFDFGFSGPANERSLADVKIDRNQLYEWEVDAFMLTMTTLQLRHASVAAMRKQMKDVNGRYFFGQIEKGHFYTLLGRLAKGDSTDLNQLLKVMVQDTSIATGSFEDVVKSLQ